MAKIKGKEKLIRKDEIRDARQKQIDGTCFDTSPHARCDLKARDCIGDGVEDKFKEVVQAIYRHLDCKGSLGIHGPACELNKSSDPNKRIDLGFGIIKTKSELDKLIREQESNASQVLNKCLRNFRMIIEADAAMDQIKQYVVFAEDGLKRSQLIHVHNELNAALEKLSILVTKDVLKYKDTQAFKPFIAELLNRAENSLGKANQFLHLFNK